MDPATNFSISAILVEKYVAGGTLLIGDVVLINDAGRIVKSATAADYFGCVGIVVGGTKTYGRILQNDLDISEEAAIDGDDVIVAWGGIVKVVADVNGIDTGDVAVPSTDTAGLVNTSQDAADYPIGTALNDAADGEIARILLAISKVALATAST
jgi:hypothetical protein